MNYYTDVVEYFKEQIGVKGELNESGHLDLTHHTVLQKFYQDFRGISGTIGITKRNHEVCHHEYDVDPIVEYMRRQKEKEAQDRYEREHDL